MNIIYTQPIAKKNYYISKTSTHIYYDIIDIKIKKITKLNEGYLLTIYIDNDTQAFIDIIDNDAKNILIKENSLWFRNELNEDDIQELFKSSYCKQNKIISVYITNNTKIFINNKLSEISDFLDKTSKHYIINGKLQLLGMFIYSNQTYNKWHMNTINVYDDESSCTDNRKELEDYWQDTINECNNKLDNQIININKIKDDIKNLYIDIINTENSIDWENKISQLKKLVQNIIF